MWTDWAVWWVLALIFGSGAYCTIEHPVGRRFATLIVFVVLAAYGCHEAA